MPKDPAENIDRYKIQGGQLNEFEVQQNEEAMAEQERARHGGPQPEGLRGAAEPGLPQNVAERIQQLEAAVREKVERRRAKQAGQSAKNAPAKAAEGVPKSRSATLSKKTAAGTAQPSGVKKAGAARKATKSGTKATATKKGAAKKQTGAAKVAKSPAKKASPAKRTSSKKRPAAGKAATKSSGAKGVAKGAAKKAASKKGSKARRG